MFAEADADPVDDSRGLSNGERLQQALVADCSMEAERETDQGRNGCPVIVP